MISKSVKIIFTLIVVGFIGCSPPTVLISWRRPFQLSQIRKMAIIPSYGNVTGCAEEARVAMESTLFSYLTGQGIQMIAIGEEKVRNVFGSAVVAGLLTVEDAKNIGRMFEVDAFISATVSECHYYDPGLGEGMVFITVKFYNGGTGEMFVQIDGQKTVEYADTKSIGHATSETVKTILETMGWE